MTYEPWAQKMSEDLEWLVRKGLAYEYDERRRLEGENAITTEMISQPRELGQTEDRRRKSAKIGYEQLSDADKERVLKDIFDKKPDERTPMEKYLFNEYGPRKENWFEKAMKATSGLTDWYNKNPKKTHPGAPKDRVIPPPGGGWGRKDETPVDPVLDYHPPPPELFKPRQGLGRDDQIRGAIHTALADLSLAMESRDNTDALERAQRVLRDALKVME